MTSRSMFAAVALAFVTVPHLASATPNYMRVTGVASDDTLNVRAEPSASSADIGDLAHDATAIEIIGTDASGNWAQIIWFDQMAWISTRFLTMDAPPVIPGSNVPAGLACGGTEPFWGITLGASEAIFSDPQTPGTALSYQNATPPAGRSGFPTLLTYAGSGGLTQSIIRPQACSDGMSDRTYPYTIDFLIDAGSGGYLEGCCYLPVAGG